MISLSFSQQYFEMFLLVLVRITSFFVLAPFFNDSNFPVRVKLILSVFVSYFVYSLMPTEQVISYTSLYDYAALIVKEALVGMLLGFSVYICNMILVFAGKVIDIEIGLSMMMMFDPTTNTQSGATGTFYSYMILMLLVVSDMHLYLLNAIVDSFQLIPVGGMKVNLTLYPTIIRFLTNYFIIGFRIVLPIFVVMLIMNCVLGIMAKVSPQMNMFAVGIQIKMLIGLMVMFLTVCLLPSIANMIFDAMKSMLTDMIGGLT